MSNIKEILNSQDDFFYKNKTRSIAFRKNTLKKLAHYISKYETEILNALNKDLSKCKEEAFMSEIMLVYDELKYIIKNIEKLAKPENVKSTLKNTLYKSMIYKEPFGKVLIFSTWNYPFQLSMIPLIGAIASGNTVILKCSEYSVHTNNIVKKILSKVFDDEYVHCIVDEVNYDDFLSEKYDYIFFTGSQRVGKIIAKKASEHLTPCTLELGSKNYCVVEKTCHIDTTARRIVFGKFLNSGQTCVAPNFLYVEECIYEELISSIKKYIKKMFTEVPYENKNYPKIVNEKHFNRLLSYIKDKELLVGGGYDVNSLKIEPTLLTNLKDDDILFKEEIFGPILPIVKYNNINDVLKQIKKGEKTLAFYLFTNNKKLESYCLNTIPFGGCTINDTVLHLTDINLPFGGVGDSGYGSYHGKYSFKTFTKEKSVLKSLSNLDVPVRFHPYDESNDMKKIKLLLKYS